MDRVGVEIRVGVGVTYGKKFSIFRGRGQTLFALSHRIFHATAEATGRGSGRGGVAAAVAGKNSLRCIFFGLVLVLKVEKR